MDFQIKLIKKNSGFTLMEILIVLSIIGILATISTSVYNNFKVHENLEITTLGVVEAIRHAQSNTQVGRGDSNWGVKFFSNSVTVFRGNNYENRDIQNDQNFNFPGGVVFDGLSEIVFEKITGSTVNTGVITLTNDYGVKNISINEKGTLTY